MKEQPFIPVLGKKYTISRELNSAIKTQNAQAKEMGTKVQEELKELSKEIIEVNTILMKMQAKVDKNGNRYWYEYIPHPSIENNIDKLIEHFDKCCNMVTQRYIFKYKKILVEHGGLKAEDLTEKEEAA